MDIKRPMIGLVVAASIGAFALPSQAAAKTSTLYFDDQGTSTPPTCKPSFVLTKTAPAAPKNYCGNTRLGVAGNGELPADDYTSLASSVGFTLDAKRAVTGTVFIAGYPPVTAAVGPAATPQYTPGPAGADITITVNGVKLRTISSSGVELPGATYAIPVKAKLPAKLNAKVVKTVVVDVQYTDAATYVGGVSRDPGSQSKLVFPTR